MKEINPVISIIMATYNRDHLIAETLDSIIKQSYENWECLIIDDGSTDNTPAIAKSYSQKEKRFKYFKRPDKHKKGLPGCRNYGLDIAEGKYVIFIDDDDIVHPDNLKITFSELEASSADYCRFLRKTFTGEFLKKFDRSTDYTISPLNISHLPDIITGVIPFNSCQVVWKRECFTTNKFEESLMYAEEWECYTRILLTGIKGINVQKVLFFGRKHAASNTGEFWKKDLTRRESKVRAVKMVVRNLEQQGILSQPLFRYFLQLGVFLKEESIIEFVLNLKGVTKWTTVRYRLLYKYYPYIVWIHRLRKKITSRQN